MGKPVRHAGRTIAVRTGAAEYLSDEPGVLRHGVFVVHVFGPTHHRVHVRGNLLQVSAGSSPDVVFPGRCPPHFEFNVHRSLMRATGASKNRRHWDPAHVRQSQSIHVGVVRSNVTALFRLFADVIGY